MATSRTCIEQTGLGPLLEHFQSDYEECRISWKVCLETEFLIILRLVTRLRSTMLAFLDVRMSFTSETWSNEPTFLFVWHTQRHSCVNRNSKWSTRSPIVYFYMHTVNKLYLDRSVAIVIRQESRVRFRKGHETLHSVQTGSGVKPTYSYMSGGSHLSGGKQARVWS